jgi:hypothetical protein
MPINKAALPSKLTLKKSLRLVFTKAPLIIEGSTTGTTCFFC